MALAAPLEGLPAAQANVVLLALAAAALALAWRSARSPSSLAGFGAVVVGAGVAALAGWLGSDSYETAGVVAAAFLVLAAGANLFLEGRRGETWGWALLALLGLGLLGFAAASLDVAAFALFAGLILFSAFKVVTVDELVHATVWLAGVLFGVAGLFLVLGAPFLAMIQVLVYVGAVITLILFTVMLTVPRKETVEIEDLELPPGITIERVEDLEPATPSYGQGPMKAFVGTNPRKALREPDTLYGVAIDDGVYGTETTVRRKTKDAEKGESKKGA